MKDSAYFSDPHTFNPENFTEENKKNRHPYAFLSFGHGPRNCIGMRFALLQVKTAIVRTVTEFKIVPSSKTVKELVPDPLSPNGGPIGGVWVKTERRKTKTGGNAPERSL
jgi:cytochrome P450